MKIQPQVSRGLVHLGRVAGALALAICLGVAVRAQEQGQERQSQGQRQQSQGQQAQGLAQQQDQGQQQANPEEAPPKPKYPPQDADKPPYSKDRQAQSSPAGPSQRSQPPAQPAQAEQAASAQPGPAAVELPDKLTVPAGTILLIRTNDFLSSDRNQIGDQFTAVLEQPVVVNGWVVARRGQVLVGQVKAAQKAGRIKGVSQLGLELTDLTVVSGQQVPILTELWKGSGGTSHGQDATTIGTTTGLGALIGAAADWGRGAAIGAGVGAAAGIGAVLLTRGRPTEIEPETPLTFRLMDPVTIDTTSSRMAFLPVTQQDFDGARPEHRRPRLAAGYPGPWWGPCGYYRPCYGYPAYFGVYEEFGFHDHRRFH
jgi:hypothetical protein